MASLQVGVLMNDLKVIPGSSISYIIFIIFMYLTSSTNIKYMLAKGTIQRVENYKGKIKIGQF